MIVKTFSWQHWDGAEPSAVLVKIAADGRLRGADLRRFEKRASGSSELFLRRMQSIKFAADEVPVHLIALGAWEAYGANRNGDAFRESALKRYHSTFEKHAYFYRNHKNRDPKRSYGIVKCSVYNPVMRRVELLVALNGSDKAAQRNGGLVADREIEKLARGDDLGVSMACRVPYDECSYCGNRAANRAEYCTEKTCAAGGCRDNLGRLVKVGNDFHHLFVHNDHPTFFDISHVFRPADRIAYGSRADWLDKTAADARAIRHEDYRVRLALALDDFDKYAGALPPLPTEVPADLPRLDRQEIPVFLGELAKRGAVLDLTAYAALHGARHLAKAAARRLPGIYQRWQREGTLAARLRHLDRYCRLDKSAGDRGWTRHLDLLARWYAADPYERACRSALTRSVQDFITDYEKSGADAERLACDYACYRLAALSHMANRPIEQFVLTVGVTAAQNQG